MISKSHSHDLTTLLESGTPKNPGLEQDLGHFGCHMASFPIIQPHANRIGVISIHQNFAPQISSKSPT